MQMRNVDLLTTRTELVPHPVSDNSQTLVATDGTAQLHLYVRKEIIVRGPAIAVVNDDITTGHICHCPRGSGCHPVIGGVLPFDHVHLRGKVDGTTDRVVMRTARRSFGSVIDPIDGVPGNSKIPRELEHICWRNICIGES